MSSSGALFGNAGSRSQSKNLVEFRAGKMYMKGNMVHPDTRKGLVYIYQSDDALTHFVWKDRSKGTVDDDLIIFPDDTEFKHVPQCTTGRVYLLKFKSTSRKMFFWMQEPKSDKDEDYCKKVNEFLNNPPTPGSTRGAGGAGAGGLGGLQSELAAGLGGDSDLQSLLGGMSQQQLMQLLGGMGMGNLGGLPAMMGGGRPTSAPSDSAPPSRVQSSPGPRSSGTESAPPPPRPVTAAALPSQSTPAAAASDTATPAADSSSRPAIQLSDLQNILSGLGGEAGARREGIDLATAVTPEAMLPILANKDVQERLLPFLPEGEQLPKTEAELRSTVASPQFQQAMQSFSAALASGQLGPLMGQFNLGADVMAAAEAGDVEAFAKAMQSGQEKKDEKK
ncbi:hypothetical protein CAPTEDRAFT_18438 [Capitella teleta]|uniref:Uncharacterized protein n=1 Tax=Capitella teleta TaxID=283909 RepID=R7TL23_CAPTE|nr:hypothetical protein CAPTEDRAFT_18438 [Capitella teleta]|eukprot:ELT94344.1 hypothetical protein CAPTEDRAFT_18438 [Capitella teleta]